jgi:AraC family transcriptional regulator, regulatory protein of adaptative response / methylated-DNA-[protein]-cysteine methyltransferase
MRESDIERDPRWAAIRARDSRAEGTFWYSVKTTGVYCRPTCGARPAKPENVDFHASPKAAERAGFRACKRCRPDLPPLAERQAATVARLCRLIEASEEEPSLERLASHVGLSVFHTHRMFKAITGLTPKAWAVAHRAKRVRAELAQRETITDAIYAAGYGSSGRFYKQSKARLGMTPTEYRRGAPNLEIRYALGSCSLGSLLVAATERGVCAILLGEDPAALTEELAGRFKEAKLIAGDRDFAGHVERAIAIVETPGAKLGLPLDLLGTAYQQRVWQALQKVPAGTTTTYSEIAKAMGEPKSTRAVARACATNAIAIAVPCHRVVRTTGELAGYYWGLERKRALIERERHQATLGKSRPGRAKR